MHDDLADLWVMPADRNLLDRQRHDLADDLRLDEFVGEHGDLIADPAAAWINGVARLGHRGPAARGDLERLERRGVSAPTMTDRAFFLSTVNLVFGSLGDKVPQEFIEDRTKLRGAPFDIKAMAAALPQHRAQVRAHLGFIEAQLNSSARNWLLGEFSLADVSAYMNVWYIRSNLAAAADELLADFPATRD